jgi:hypothetical protein
VNTLSGFDPEKLLSSDDVVEHCVARALRVRSGDSTTIQGVQTTQNEVNHSNQFPGTAIKTRIGNVS